MEIFSSYMVPFLPLILYLAYAFLIEASRKKKGLKNLVRRANGCRSSTCMHFIIDKKDGEYCGQDNREHFDNNSHSDNSCENSQARISQDELNLYKTYYSKRAADFQNIIAIIAILVTAIIALLKQGNCDAK
jgi:hypothetical protein